MTSTAELAAGGLAAIDDGPSPLARGTTSRPHLGASGRVDRAGRASSTASKASAGPPRSASGPCTSPPTAPQPIEQARRAAEAAGGWLLREAGDGFDGFGTGLPNRALMARIKDAFDPAGKFSPGASRCEASDRGVRYPERK